MKQENVRELVGEAREAYFLHREFKGMQREQGLKREKPLWVYLGDGDVDSIPFGSFEKRVVNDAFVEFYRHRSVLPEEERGFIGELRKLENSLPNMAVDDSLFTPVDPPRTPPIIGRVSGRTSDVAFREEVRRKTGLLFEYSLVQPGWRNRARKFNRGMSGAGGKGKERRRRSGESRKQGVK
jgi:hypothetical protein